MIKPHHLEVLKNEIREIKSYLIPFLKNPMVQIKSIPDWTWTRLIWLQMCLAAGTGALTGLVEHKISWSIILGAFVSPILTLITLSVASLFFYYCFQIFSERTLHTRKLFTVVLLANIPQFIFQIVASYIPPIYLVGLAFTGILLLVGLVENFQLDKKLTIKIISVLYAIFLTLWVWNRISAMKSDHWDRSENIPAVELGK